MKKFFVLAVMLSVVLFGFGTSHAVLGVADDVPGTDVVIPFICEKGGTMNTLWAVGDVRGGIVGSISSADILVFDRRSVEVYDDVAEWTPLDIVSSDCQTLVAGMSPTQQTALEMTIGGKTYYAGYLVYFNFIGPDNRFVPWVYLVDLPKGFAAGFNGFAAENFVGLAGLDEGGIAVTASALFPRYLILNNNAETFNWWIVLKGANGAADALNGVICNEEERCISLKIAIPDELNVINVAPHLPAILHAGVFPKAGMGIFATVPPGPFTAFTTLGWSYQRAQGSSVAASWSVIHPMHRDY